MKTQIDTAELGAEPARYERDAIDVMLDVGSTSDWITPTYGAVRDLLVDGKTFTVDSDTWHGMQPLLAKHDISPWAVSMCYQNGDYWYVFSVDADDAPAVERFTGYRRTGGRGKAIVMLLVLAAVLGGGFLLAAALAAAVGGGL